MNQVLKKVILSCLFILMTALVFDVGAAASKGKAGKSKKTTQVQKKAKSKKKTASASKKKKSKSKRVRRMPEESDEERQLMADKVTIKRELQVADSLILQEELELEEKFFPSDELYGIWTTRHVNPYANENIVIPDSFNVDLSTFVMPFEGKVTSDFGPRWRRMHYGTDIKVEVGDTIRAAFAGKVRVKYFQRRGYGYYMVIRHQNGLETVYGHLSNFLVDQEDVVEAGQPIALGGNTGRSTGSHLHFEIRFLGQPINPAKIVDFDNFVAHTDSYVIRKGDLEGRSRGSVSYAKSKNRKNSKKEIARSSSGKSATKAVYHKVQRGDTLYGISQKYGVSVEQLRRINNIKSPSSLKAGKSIRCS